MRTMLLIIAASVAGQLPARDVPHSIDGATVIEGTQAGDEMCPDKARAIPALLGTGPTVFASPGSIA